MSDEGHKHWFYLLAEDTEHARLHHAARLIEKAWQQGDRVGIYCAHEEQAQALDEVLWGFRPEAFLPHGLLTQDHSGERSLPREPIGLFWHEPSPAHWQTLIVLSPLLPSASIHFQRLALIANADPNTLQQARRQYRQLKDQGVTPQVLDLRARHV